MLCSLAHIIIGPLIDTWGPDVHIPTVTHGIFATALHQAAVNPFWRVAHAENIHDSLDVLRISALSSLHLSPTDAVNRAINCKDHDTNLPGYDS